MSALEVAKADLLKLVILQEVERRKEICERQEKEEGQRSLLRFSFRILVPIFFLLLGAAYLFF